LAVGLSIAYLLFGVWASFSGLVGFVVVTYIAFLLTYAALVATSDSGPAVRDRIATVVLWSVTTLVIFSLASVIATTVYKGWAPLWHWNFYTQDLSTTTYNSPYSHGGIYHALIGTLWSVGIALFITVPLGLCCAVFLSEVGGPFARLVRTIAEAMTALPSIVAGLFIYILWIVQFHGGHSGFAAALALSVTMLPIMIRASDVVLRLVPGNLREASYALGAPKWRTVWRVVLPTARSGLATAVILTTAWGIGETAPVLLTAGYTTYLNYNPFRGPMVSLPLVAYELVRTGLNRFVAVGFATASFLLVVVVILFLIARLIGGRGPGHVTGFGTRRMEKGSARDLSRIESRSIYTAFAIGVGPGSSDD
jgi:phosphate transport system permease protein